MDVTMARARMATNIPFDAEYAAALQELIKNAGMVYPPPTEEDADAIYIALQNEMHAIEDD